MEQGGWVHPSPGTPPPLPGKDPKYVWLVTDQGGREVVASCQPGFPDPKLPSRRLFSESLGWGAWPELPLPFLLGCPRTLQSGPVDTGHQGQTAVHIQLPRSH